MPATLKRACILLALIFAFTFTTPTAAQATTVTPVSAGQWVNWSQSTKPLLASHYKYGPYKYVWPGGRAPYGTRYLRTLSSNCARTMWLIFPITYRPNTIHRVYGSGRFYSFRCS